MFEVGTAVEVDGDVQFVCAEPTRKNTVQLTFVLDDARVLHDIIFIGKDGSCTSPRPPNKVVHECADNDKIKTAYTKLSTAPLYKHGGIDPQYYAKVLRQIRKRYHLYIRKKNYINYCVLYT